MYGKLHPTYSVSSGGDRPLPYGSTTITLKSLCNTLKLIYIWLQKFDTNYVWHCNDYNEINMSFLRRLPIFFLNPSLITPRKKPALSTEIWGNWYVKNVNEKFLHGANNNNIKKMA